MKFEICSEKIPIKLWAKDIDPGALAQAKNLANLPFAFSHIAVMPDAHQGYGMPIGGVLATRDMIVPNAVGVDIGCGICAVQTSLTGLNKKEIRSLLHDARTGISKRIPLGFKWHKQAQDDQWMPDPEIISHRFKRFDRSVVGRYFEDARKQVGTLGGGNHFIEIEAGSDGRIWLMIHSGSRNLGLKVAEFYNQAARSMRDRLNKKIPPSWDLDALPMDSNQGQAYFAEMTYCVEFARKSRELMMHRVQEAVSDAFPKVSYAPAINIAHNYAASEVHFGRRVIVHRKGATKAFCDTTGIVPGSQGTASFIVRGLGNPDSFMSCSHGAGRKMGRRQARKQLDLSRERRRLDRKGIVHALASRSDLDEAPGAYKDIERVMENQSDLVDILVILEPLGVIKG